MIAPGMGQPQFLAEGNCSCLGGCSLNFITLLFLILVLSVLKGDKRG
jgi:hypothetical protein